MAAGSQAAEWALSKRGAGQKKINRWDRTAGFPPGTQWCGIFLGAAMRAVGLTPPTGYAAATNWSSYGTKVNRGELQPGDILVYGSNHVAMYIGHGQQVQGNDENGTVGTSGIGSSLGLGPITAIRRPAYKGDSSGGESVLERAAKGTLEQLPGGPLLAQATGLAGEAGGKVGEAAGGVAGEVAQGLVSDVAKSAEPLMLNIGLIFGGAFLIYYGAALMAGVDEPALKLLRAGKTAGVAAAA